MIPESWRDQRLGLEGCSVVLILGFRYGIVVYYAESDGDETREDVHTI